MIFHKRLHRLIRSKTETTVEAAPVAEAPVEEAPVAEEAKTEE